MFGFIPIFLAIAGIIALFTRRRVHGLAAVAARVVVKGATFSESVDQKPVCREIERTVEVVRRCCVIGGGRVGAITGIILASRNPGVEFCVVDCDERLIASWKSESLPFVEPGLEEILFDDCIDVDTKRISSPDVTGTEAETTVVTAQPRRKLPNLAFSTDVHAGVAAADVIFLCVEMGDEESPSLKPLESTLQIISRASRGHKIIVHRMTSPYGTITHIQDRLTEISSPSASFTLLTNPAFTLPGTTILDMLDPPRIILGHIYTAKPSPQSLAAVRDLYTSWIPEDRVVTMDAYSAELGRIAAKAVLAQQGASVAAVRMLCEASEAGMGNVGWMLGCGLANSSTNANANGNGNGNGKWGMGDPDMRREVRCLVYLARELGMAEVAAYWEAVLRMEEVQWRGLAGKVIKGLEGFEKRIALVELVERREMAIFLERELRKADVEVRVFDERLNQGILGQEGSSSSLEDACKGCTAIILGSCTAKSETWERIVSGMEGPKLVVDIAGEVDLVRMKQLGFGIL
ncbi:hypothetical protein BJX99DRAFT_257794 [Aspergillus californicus]